MAKRNRQATRGNDRQAWPAWVWMGLGILLGLALSAVVLIKDWAPILRKKNLPQPNAEATAPSESETAIVDDNNKNKDKPGHKTFDFYQVLPEMEVVIPDAELSAKAKAEQQARTQTPTTATTIPPATSTQPSVRYLLQAGSYPEAKAADEVKAKLALLGFTAKVQPVTINGRTWHRVRVGPYNNASELESAKRTITDNGLAAVALKETAGQ